MGITEPALYGLNVPKKYPLIAGCIGDAAGSLFAGITATRRFATGSSGLPAVVMYIGDNSMRYFYQILIALVITITVSTIATVILFKRYEGKDKAEKKVESEQIILNDDVTITSPADGRVIPLSQVDDEVFSTGLLGKGVGIEPTDNQIVAPFDGVISTLFPTKHAIGITSTSGNEVLIHIGIETVELEGKYFDAHVKQGDHVKRGQLLVTVDFEKIKEAGYNTQIPVVITNSNDYENVEPVDISSIHINDLLMKVQPKLA